MTDLTDLIARVEALTQTDNAVDVLIELALFEPCDRFIACRANAAGTKVIYTRRNGLQLTCWAQDWTLTKDDRAETVRLLKERLANV